MSDDVGDFAQGEFNLPVRSIAEGSFERGDRFLDSYPLPIGDKLRL